MEITLFSLAQRFVGEIHEIEGPQHSPFIQWCHEAVGLGTDAADEIPWCSSFLNRCAWLLRLPRSKSAAARSWLGVGIPISNHQAVPGDVVILKRGAGEQPGPEAIAAPGHVGLFAGYESGSALVLILGGNQRNAITVAPFLIKNILGIRRL